MKMTVPPSTQGSSVLPRLVETVHLVDEEDGALAVVSALLLLHRRDLLDAGEHGVER